MIEVFWTALRLGLTSFGGPIAHLGYFERIYVRERRWLSSAEYASLVALCQMLPGPTSSQVGFLIGLRRAGWRGGLAAWLGFTLPSALLMYSFAFVPLERGVMACSIVHGLMLTAVVVVAQALWSMARTLCPDWQRAALALAAAATLLIGPNTPQVLVLAAGAVAGWVLCKGTLPQSVAHDSAQGRVGAILFVVYVSLLCAALAVRWNTAHGPVTLAAIFYQAGALVFGGGHVVLPLLRQELVPGGWLSDPAFLTGYGLAQAMPGPLFSVSAYLGAVAAPSGLAPLWAAIALGAMFLPGMLLARAGLALQSRAQRFRHAPAALAGVNAAVVGVLGAAFYDPVWTTGVQSATDLAVAAVGFVLLQFARTSVLLVALLCLGGSFLRAYLVLQC